MGLKFLVTGGAGFIGSNIVEELLIRGFDVRILDNFSTGKRENLKEFQNDVELFEGDVRSYHWVQKAVKGADFVLHLAALPSVPRSIVDPITTTEVNILGTLNMLNASVEAGIKKFVFASSSSVYGDNPELPKHEKMIPNPKSPYAASKLAGEHYCKVFGQLYGLDTVSLRYFNVFGPKQDPASQYSAVIPKFIKIMRENNQPVIYGDGLQSRDFTYVANVVESNILAAFSDQESGLVMNCACHEQITLNMLTNEINILLNKSIEPYYASPRLGDIKHSFANIDLIKEKLKFNPVVDFHEGLARTVRAMYLKKTDEDLNLVQQKY